MHKIDFYDLGKNYILYFNKENLNNNLNNLNKEVEYNLNGNLNEFDHNILLNDNILTNFLRGYIEINSRLFKPDFNKSNNNELIFRIFFRRDDYFIIDYINKNWDIQMTIIESIFIKNNILFNYYIEFSFMCVLDILSKIYSTIDHNNLFSDKNQINDDDLYYEYMNLCNYYNINFDSDNILYKLPKCTYKKNLASAILPYKDKTSNIGYNISIVSIKKNINENIFIYDTGIGIKPEFGYYFEIVPNNNLIKYGYIFANSNIIINPMDFNSIFITLIKIDPLLPEMKLPFKCAYILLKKFTHYEFKLE